MTLFFSRARVESQNHWFTYDEKMQVGYFSSLRFLLAFWFCQQLLKASHLTGGECGPGSFKPCHPVWWLWWRCWGHVKVLIPIYIILHFCDSLVTNMSVCRPFGVAILFAGMDDNGTQLYHMDPSGTYLQVGHLQCICNASPLMRLQLLCLPVWRQGDRLWKWGSPTEFARGLNLRNYSLTFKSLEINLKILIKYLLQLGLPQEHDPKGGHKVCFHHPEAGAYLIYNELLNLSPTIQSRPPWGAHLPHSIFIFPFCRLWKRSWMRRTWKQLQWRLRVVSS